MTVYELIGELACLPADMEVVMKVKSVGLYDDLDTGKSAYVCIEKETNQFSCPSEMWGKCLIEIDLDE